MIKELKNLIWHFTASVIGGGLIALVNALTQSSQDPEPQFQLGRNECWLMSCFLLHLVLDSASCNSLRTEGFCPNSEIQARCPIACPSCEYHPVSKVMKSLFLCFYWTRKRCLFFSNRLNRLGFSVTLASFCCFCKLVGFSLPWDLQEGGGTE